MLKILRSIIRNMSSETESKLTLAKKLGKGGRVQKIQKEAVLPDIEDSVGVTKKSQYFSPVQTRQQRKINLNPPKKDETIHLIKQSSKSLKKELLIKDELESDEKDINKLHNDAEEKQWQPREWQRVLKNIREMRSITDAPVDSMGCHKCSDQDATEKIQRFQKLVALMLSSQTKDETTFQAMQRLRDHTLTPESIVQIEVSTLQELLCPVSFYKNKAKYLQQTSRILMQKYSSDIPNNIKELIALPGVGPKMAHICMATAWNEVTGIGVDVHVHRITNRLKWVPKSTKEPEHTRIALEAWLPRDLWREVNYLLVGFGQTICTPVRPHCSDCLNRDICPASSQVVVKETPEPSIKKPKIQRKKILL